MGMTDIALVVMAAAMAGSVIGFAAAANMVAWGVIAAAILVLLIALCRRMWINQGWNAHSAKSCDLDHQYIKAMSLHRHDWINEIQLLTTYFKLRKIDKFNETVETIREKALQESRLFQIGAPGLVLFLYCFSGMYPHVKLTWQMESDFSLDVSDERKERVTALMQRLICHFAEEADRRTEHMIEIGMFAGNQGEAVIDMTFTGTCNSMQSDHHPMVESFERLLRRSKRCGVEWETEVADQWVRVTLRVPQNSNRAIIEV